MLKSRTIQVPQDLAQKLWQKFNIRNGLLVDSWRDVLNCAAQWGYDLREPEIQQAADQELEAVKHWLTTGPYAAFIVTSVAPDLVADLCTARRPKPSTLTEQGLEILSPSRGAVLLGTPEYRLTEFQAEVLRAALSRLDKLENRLKELED